MKKTITNKKLAALLAGTLLLMLFAVSGIGYAASVSFSDTIKYWGDGTSWSSQAWNTDVPNGQWDGNNIDVIGDPDILGGVATFNASGNLTRITFNYTSPEHNWAMLAPGNLFINVLNGANDTTWDYVVTTMGTPNLDQSGASPSLIAGNYNLYNITSQNVDAKRIGNDLLTINQDNPQYILSGADNTGAWAGYYLRNNHPIGLADSVLSGLASSSVYFSGFPGDVVNNDPWARTSYYDFGQNGLNLDGKDIIIGWETTCANDVVYVQVSNPVPEPGTLMLLGSGLIAAAAMGRKMKIHK
jgi:hypothetical protein